MRKSFVFYKVLTPAEVGATGTHEIYIRMPNNFDYSTFFGNTAVVNGSVTEVYFNATDESDGKNNSVPLRFVYFHSSNQEKRIPSLGTLFQKHNIQSGDIVRLESKLSPVQQEYSIRFYKKGDILLSSNYIYFSDEIPDAVSGVCQKLADEPMQQIYYGAPGTGKSHIINQKTKGFEVIRTTFHPDSDYSTFVGAYKPTMGDPKPIYGFDQVGKTVKVEDPKGTVVNERKIEYKFIKQAFLKAYLKAWKRYSEGGVTVPVATSSSIVMPTGSAKSPYSSTGFGPIPPSFQYTAKNNCLLTPSDLDLLKKVDAFLFPFKNIVCLGDLHDKIEVIVTDKPEPGQVLIKKTKFDVASLKRERDSLGQKIQSLLQTDPRSPELVKLNHRKEYIDTVLSRIMHKRNLNSIDELPDEVEIDEEETLLGLCVKSANGIKIYLFMDNINDGNHDTERLVSTYIHEMFHAYYNTKGPKEEIEEAIVEYSMLCFLELISDKDSAFAGIFAESLKQVDNMKDSMSFSYYGFGSYLFKNRSIDWMKIYTEGNSKINQNSALLEDYCNGFKGAYPFGFEQEYMKKLYELLKGNNASSGWCGNKPVFLVIEEINRGNCAQIFGDVFQLLDRGDKGFSQYPIEPDSDIQNEIGRAFSEDPEYQVSSLNVDGIIKDYTSTTGKTLSEDILSGHVMLFPNNLFIWATMNTSDQSLFPIDSAFKRRWDWKYIRIAEGKDEKGNILGWKIGVKDSQGVEYDWWEFLKKINGIINSMTQSADKQLGYFFCKDINGKISADTFVNKVLFYLWNDVFKDYAYEDGSLFGFKKVDTDKEESILSFPDFFNESGDVDENIVCQFIDNVLNWKEGNDKTDQE